MLTLALTFCLSGPPGTCLPPRYADLDTASPMGCMVQAQQVAAELLSTEPELRGYVLRGWQCGVSAVRRERA